jgi:hypothetical protein
MYSGETKIANLVGEQLQKKKKKKKKKKIRTRRKKIRTKERMGGRSRD